MKLSIYKLSGYRHVVQNFVLWRIAELFKTAIGPLLYFLFTRLYTSEISNLIGCLILAHCIILCLKPCLWIKGLCWGYESLTLDLWRWVFLEVRQNLIARVICNTYNTLLCFRLHKESFIENMFKKIGFNKQFYYNIYSYYVNEHMAKKKPETWLSIT
jgi:hypothetical protein